MKQPPAHHFELRRRLLFFTAKSDVYAILVFCGQPLFIEVAVV